MTDSTRDSRMKTLDPQVVKDSTTIRRTDELDDDLERDAVTPGDVSPHLGGRAQPGDILGIETGGETTGIGETSEDENKRRHALEKDVVKAREDELRDEAKDARKR
jgi:hypothetical protein